MGCLIVLLVVLAGSTVGAADAGRADSSVADLLSRADAANTAKNYAAADSLATRALGLLDAQPSADPLQRATADLLVARSLVSRRMMTDSRALDSAARALQLTEANVPDDDPRRGDAEFVMAWTLSTMGRTEGVLEHAHKALAIQRRSLGNDAEPVAATLRVVALHFERLGQADSARAAYVEAVAIRERLNVPRDMMVGILHIDLSRIEESCGNIAEARAQTGLALQDFETRLGPSDPMLMQAWRRYSSLEWGAGDYSRAADFGERALDMAVADPQTDPVDLALIRGALAWPLYSLEDHVRARKLLTEAIPVLSARFGPTHPQTVRYRMTFLQVLQASGDTTAALTEVGSLLSALESDSTFADDLAIADLMCQEADLVADPSAAIALCDRAAAVGSRRGPPDPELLLQIDGVKLPAQARRGDWAGMDATVRELQATLERRTVRRLATEVWVLEQRSYAEVIRGNAAEAFRLALEASRQSREVLLQNLRSLPDREGLRFAAGRFPPVHQLLGLTKDAAAETAWDELIRWRGLVGAEIRGRRVPRGKGVDEKVTAAHAEWIRSKSLLAQMETRFASGGNVPGGEARLDSLRAAAGAAERQWAKVAPRALIEASSDVGLAEIRAALGSADALVSFSISRKGEEPKRIVAFVARGGSSRKTVRMLDLGPLDAIETQVERWRAKASRSPRGDAGAEQACRAEGVALRSLTWDVIAPAVEGAADVYLVADGPLHELSWAALPDGEHGYLVERSPTFHVLDAERDLVDQTRPSDAGRGLLALGGIDFDRRSGTENATKPAPLATSSSAVHGCTGEALRALPALPGTGQEVQAIGKERKDARILAGSDATEVSFKSLAPGQAVIHLATHGIVLASDCEEAQPGSRGVGGVAPLSEKPAAPDSSAEQSARTSREVPSPWLGRRTFLALAGANRAREHVDDENEGFLTAEEVSTLDLRGTEWVVLSACRSGVAESWETEGVLGMRRAFRLAGARSVIASQWDVDDDATREWMTALYARDDATSNAAVAVQRASRSVLDARRAAGKSTHPFYWAAFTASGE